MALPSCGTNNTELPLPKLEYVGQGRSYRLTVGLSVLAAVARRHSLAYGHSVLDERADTACAVSVHGSAASAARWWRP